MAYYTQKICDNPDWDFAGIYAEQKSGTRVDNRDEIQRLMNDCRDDKGNLVIIEEEAKIVRLIYDLFLRGYRCRKIKKYLEDHGIKTVTGKE